MSATHHYGSLAYFLREKDDMTRYIAFSEAMRAIREEDPVTLALIQDLQRAEEVLDRRKESLLVRLDALKGGEDDDS